MLKTERARTLLTFLAADPDDTFSRYALAMEYRKMGETSACIEVLEEVLRRDPDYLGAYYHLGQQLVLDSQAEKGLEVFRRGLALAASNDDAHAASELRQAIAQLELDMD